VVPAADFNAVADAHTLRTAMKGWGTDEQAIIDVLCHRSNAQRQTIIDAYKKEFGRVEEDGTFTPKDLVADLKKELGGKFEDVIVGLMMPTVDYCAKQCHKAIKGLGTDEDLLVEILCSRPADEVRAISEAYQLKYGNMLDADISSDCSGPFGRLLVLAVNCVKEENFVDVGAARKQAEALFQAGEAMIGTDEDTFVEILSKAGQRQAYYIFEEYKKISGKSIDQALKSEMSGDLLNGLLAIVKTTHNRPRYFSERLHEAMKGLGTDDTSLIRLIVSRCEIDLANIKYEFERDHGKTLYSAVKTDLEGETSGDYRKALLALIGDA